ncbi:MAG: hypothetical protein G01um101420_416 [Parcubacteria group bacterium Gr01-1014_20]|nr:MAG: hypothetical protein G01um101420_416 [Parcubacteria group bacterium Gr01-1014_20]
MSKAITDLIHRFTTQAKRELTAEEALNYLMANPVLSPLVRKWRDSGTIRLYEIDPATLDQIWMEAREPTAQLKKLAELALFLVYLGKSYRLKLENIASETSKMTRSKKSKKTRKSRVKKLPETVGSQKPTRKKPGGRVPFKREAINKFFLEQQSSLKQVLTRLLVTDQLSANATAIKISATTGTTVTCGDIQNWAKAYDIVYDAGRKKNGLKTTRVHSRRVPKKDAATPPVPERTTASLETDGGPDIFDQIKGLQVSPSVKAKLKALIGECNGREPKNLAELLNFIDKDASEIPFAASQLGIQPAEYIRLRQNVIHAPNL